MTGTEHDLDHHQRQRKNLRLAALRPSFARGKDAVLALPQLTHRLIDRFLETFKNPHLASKAYRFLARQIANDLGMIPAPKLIVFSSASTAESSNQVLLMFSHFLQDELAARVLILDATFTQEGVTDLLDLQAVPGFLQLVYGQGFDLAPLIQRVGVQEISFLPAGQMDAAPSSYIRPEKIDELVAAFGDRYDYIIIQQGHIASDTRHLLLAKKAHLFLLHMEEQTTPVAEFERAIEVLSEQLIVPVRYLLSEP